MVALVILGIFLGYLALAVLTTVAAVRLARAKGLSRRKCWLSGGAVALVFYLIPFWDWIPTVVAHKYYCATEAKFEVYKTVDQWKKENAEILPILRYDPRAPIVRVDKFDRFPLNQRVATESRTMEVFLSVKREEGRLIDLKNGEVLARYADFRAGYASFGVGGEGAWKFWLMRSACEAIETGLSPISLYSRYTHDYEFGRVYTYEPALKGEKK